MSSVASGQRPGLWALYGMLSTSTWKANYRERNRATRALGTATEMCLLEMSMASIKPAGEMAADEKPTDRCRVVDPTMVSTEVVDHVVLSAGADIKDGGE